MIVLLSRLKKLEFNQEEEESVKSLSAQIKELKNEYDELLSQEELNTQDSFRLHQLTAEIERLEQLLEKKSITLPFKLKS
ncbi:hypothetical protein [Rhodohalobacter sp.]|uniref:hypothetical protein n=1 Tax=Rhodohalobacter sp. TaxID=1974210 RepID=UPI002ACEA729|nr:hypothetical protein [Rhodohalobacter sp.]MDZ7758397.1 hypothetical protein [Rhodohalobacter sp.]